MRVLAALLMLATLAAPFVLHELADDKPPETKRTAGTAEWDALFDGKTLEGWTDEEGPHSGDAKWTVEDGIIVGRQGPNGEGGLLYTKKHYRNFEVALETKIDYPFDSGVFVRMVDGKKGAQVTLDYRDGGEIGGIYSGSWFWHVPHGKDHFHEGWNRVRVRCVGTPMHLTTWINDVQVSDYTMPAAHAYAEAGMIGVQVHPVAKQGPETARFRNLRVRELPDDAASFAGPDRLTLTPLGKQVGWERLTWEQATTEAGYRIENNELALLVEGASPHLMSAKDYRDFHLRMDFMISKMANSGVFLRATRDDKNPAYSGCEVQILDDFNWEKESGSKLATTQFTGSLYGAKPPRVKAMKPLGQWNTYEIHYVGNRLQTVLNGKILYDVDTSTLETNPPFSDRAPAGFIGIQRHAPKSVEGTEYAWFRNVFVRPDTSAGPPEAK